MSGQRVVVLSGSARPRGESTSESLANYLCERLEPHFETEMFAVNHARRSSGLQRFLFALDRADIFVVATPLYVDSLPYLVTQAFERIAAHRQRRPQTRAVHMIALINCGFPEAFHTHVALDICRVFAGRANFAWQGGLGLGGGEAISGRALHQAGWVARNVTRALDLTADALLKGALVPAEAIALMATPLMHTRLYTLAASLGWYRRAMENGVVRQLRARPFHA